MASKSQRIPSIQRYAGGLQTIFQPPTTGELPAVAILPIHKHSRVLAAIANMPLALLSQVGTEGCPADRLHPNCGLPW